MKLLIEPSRVTRRVTNLRELFEASLDDFVRQNVEMILADVSERSLCSQLGRSMSARLPEFGIDGYHVDVEYNRNHGKVKRIIDGRARVIPITCDLILHSRGLLSPDNLIALEMKKCQRPEGEKTADRERLEALTLQDRDGIYLGDGTTKLDHVSGYALGIFLQVDRQIRCLLIEYFENAVLVRRDTRYF